MEGGLPAYDRWNLAALPESALDFLVSRYIVRHGLTLLVGEGGASKSWLALDLAIALAVGDCWMGQDCAITRSVYFDEDGSEIESVRRYRRLCAARELKPDDPRLVANFSMVPAQGLHLEKADIVARVCDTIEAYGAHLVIFDALVAIHGMEENSNNEMKFIMRERIRAIMRVKGVTVLLIHHLAKANELSIPGTSQIRGAGEIVNASDAALLAKAKDGGHQLSMVRSKMIAKDKWPAALEYQLMDRDDSTHIALSRLTDDQLRHMHQAGKTFRQLEQETGISRSRLNRIVSGVPH